MLVLIKFRNFKVWQKLKHEENNEYVINKICDKIEDKKYNNRLVRLVS